MSLLWRPTTLIAVSYHASDRKRGIEDDAPEKNLEPGFFMILKHSF